MLHWHILNWVIFLIIVKPQFPRVNLFLDLLCSYMNVDIHSNICNRKLESVKFGLTYFLNIYFSRK